MSGGQASQFSCMRHLRKRRTEWYFVMGIITVNMDLTHVNHGPAGHFTCQIVFCRFSKQIGQIEERLYKNVGIT